MSDMVGKTKDEKTINVVFDQVRDKPTCTSTEDG